MKTIYVRLTVHFILSFISNSQVMVGGASLELTNRDVSEGMLHALHNRVKWGDRPEDAASLAVILLKVRGHFT